MKTKFSTSWAIKAILGIFLTFSIVMPLLAMLIHIKASNIRNVIKSPMFAAAIRHSVWVAVTATAISVGIAILLAWCIVRTNVAWKGFFAVLFTVPMLIPSISHGMGLIILLGKNGLIANLLHIEVNIYGFWGIVIGSVLYSFPVAFLMVSDVLKYEDRLPYEAAAVLGIPRSSQFEIITLPYLRRPLISVIFSVFTLVITDYGVPLMVGGQYKTLPVMMYQEVIGLLDFAKGGLLGTILLIPAAAAFLVDFFSKDEGNSAYEIQSVPIVAAPLKNRIACFICIFAGFLIVLPIVSFTLLTFLRKYPSDTSFTLEHVKRTIDLGGGQYFINSLLIAVLVALIGCAGAYVMAYFTARIRGPFTKLLHLLSIVSLAIPGLVLGLSYTMFFKGTFLYGTFAILILVNIVHFFASPYLMAFNSFNKLNANFEAVGQSLGIPRIRLVWRILIPQMLPTIFEMFSYFFVNSMITISAVSFLTTIQNMPVSLMITQFEAQMLLECSALISLLLLLSNITVKGILYAIKSKFVKC